MAIYVVLFVPFLTLWLPRTSAIFVPPNSTLCGHFGYEKACPEGCYAGFALDHKGNVTCLETTPGFYSEEDKPHSLPCSSGYFQPYFRATECFPCPIGTFAPNLAATECMPCPPGYFQPKLGQSSCVPCDPTFYSGHGADRARRNDTLVLYKNDTAVLYCEGSESIPSLAPSEAPRNGLSSKAPSVVLITPTQAPDKPTPSSVSPSQANSPTSFLPSSERTKNDNGNELPTTRPWSSPYVISATSLAAIFVISALTVTLSKRPNAQVQPTRDAEISRHNDYDGSSFAPVEESNLFSAFERNENVELPQRPPPPMGEENADGNFFSPPGPEANNHLVPQPPALVTPWHPDEELGFNPEESKESETSFDEFLENRAEATIIGGSPEDFSNICSVVNCEAAEMVVDLESATQYWEDVQRSPSYTFEERDDSVYSDYQFSPMSGSSQV